MIRATACAVLLVIIAAAPGLAASPSASRSIGPRLVHDRGSATVRFVPGVSAASADALAASHGLVAIGRLDALGVRQYRSASGPLGPLLARLRREARVRWAEPAHVLRVSLDPDDSHFAAQWGLPAISAPDAWATTRGSFGAVIAIVDTGVDLSHPDLAGKLLPGYDFVDDDTVPEDENGHGTFVAGVAGALTNNGQGVAGVSWASRILPLRVLDADGSGTDQSVADAIVYAADKGARVINLSLGGPDPSQLLDDAVDYATARGTVVVAATGNDGASSISWPARYAPVVAVGSVRRAGPGLMISSFSNRGTNIDVVAPGEGIVSTAPNGYASGDGTSFATPFVSGLAALLLSRDPLLTPSQVSARIHATADDLGPAGYDTTYGAGIVDAAAALAATPKADAADTTAPAVRFLGPVQPGTLVAGTVTVQAQASDANEVVQVDLIQSSRIRAFNHPAQGADAGSASVSHSWSSASVPDGLRAWSAPAVDRAGNVGRADSLVLVANSHPTDSFLRPTTTGAVGSSKSTTFEVAASSPLVARLTGPAGAGLTLSIQRADGSTLKTATGTGSAWLALPSIVPGTYRLRATSSIGSASITFSAGWYR
jgi:subtilisin family serine protease